jgi:UbiD family decarboxylase
LRKLVPAPTNTEEDAGPYYYGYVLCFGPRNWGIDITIHRLCLQSKDELSMYLVPGARHLGVFLDKAEKAGKPLPISISIGVDPAIEIAACFEPPTTPLGFNELSIAGAIRKQGVELVKCLTINEKAIANAEYVNEGELLQEYGFAKIRILIPAKLCLNSPAIQGRLSPRCL